MALNIVWYALDVLQWIVFGYVILSWVVLMGGQTSFRWRFRQLFNFLSQLFILLSKITNPILRPFRRLLPAYKTGGFDFSPMLLWLSILLLQKIAWGVAYQASVR